MSRISHAFRALLTTSAACLMTTGALGQNLPPGFFTEVLFPRPIFINPDPPPGNEGRVPSISTLETLPDGRILIGTGDTRAFLWDPVKNVDGMGDPTLPDPIFDYQGFSSGEMGVTGRVASPDYLTDGVFFVAYTYWPYPWDDPSTRRIRIERMVADLTDTNEIVPAESTVIFDIQDEWATDFHFSGCVEIGPDDMLYLSVGDDANVSNPQNMNSFRGKILRMDYNGDPLPDNPFYEDADREPINYIYSLGLRNPFRIQYDESTGLFYSNDTGQSLWEEINVITPGSNHGWPIIEGPLSDNAGANPPVNYTDPYYTYMHGIQGHAIVSTMVGDSAMFPAEYQGDLLVSDWGNFSDDSEGEIFRIHRDAAGAIEEV